MVFCFICLFTQHNAVSNPRGRLAGSFQHCSFKKLIVLLPLTWFPHSSPEAPSHQAAREPSTSEGRTFMEGILLAIRNLLQLLGSFTCRKVGTWGRLFNFPSEGRHAEDFLHRKNPTASVGFGPANSGTRGQHTNH
jgi:hypothetical protein